MVTNSLVHEGVLSQPPTLFRRCCRAGAQNSGPDVRHGESSHQKEETVCFIHTTLNGDLCFATVPFRPALPAVTHLDPRELQDICAPRAWTTSCIVQIYSHAQYVIFTEFHSLGIRLWLLCTQKIYFMFEWQ